MLSLSSEIRKQELEEQNKLHRDIQGQARIHWSFPQEICWKDISSHTCISDMVFSTSRMDSWPLNIEATVKYLPWRGSHATIIPCELNIWLVSSDTVKDRYISDRWLMSGACAGMKKWRRGKGTMFTASLRRSAFNWKQIENLIYK